MMLACSRDVCTVQDEQIGLLSQQDLQRCSPVLHGFVRDYLHSAALPASVKDLLRAMLQVRMRYAAGCAEHLPHLLAVPLMPRLGAGVPYCPSASRNTSSRQRSRTAAPTPCRD